MISHGQITVKSIDDVEEFVATDVRGRQMFEHLTFYAYSGYL